jgi:hypothetical protein
LPALFVVTVHPRRFLMLARLLVSLGSTAAAVGFTLFGMATTFIKHDEDLANLSYILMGAGLAATVLGAIWYRFAEKGVEAAMQVQAQRVGAKR